MGKPIAGRDMYPFTINGIVVDGANINGKTYVKELFIFQQRSYNLYDLISSDGEVFEFVEITWREKDNTLLNYYDNSSFIVERIKDNSFFIKVQDVRNNIYGFVTLLQLNKIKVSTGDYIYTPNDSEIDYSLLSVRCVPATVQSTTGESITIDVSFLPHDFSNTEGTWTIETADDIIIEEPTSRTTTPNTGPAATFSCLKPGHAVVSFTPNANKMLTATAHIFVEETKPTYTSFIVKQRYTADDYRLYSPSTSYYTSSTIYYDNAKTYFPGDEITLSVIFDPIDYVPTEEMQVEYDKTIFEYIGTDDRKDYKFKVLENTTANSNCNIVFHGTGDNPMKSTGTVLVRQLSDSVTPSIWGSARVWPNTEFQYRLSPYSKPRIGKTIWGVSDDSLASIDEDGLCTIKGEGSFYITCQIYDSDNVGKYNIESNSNIPEFVYYDSNVRTAYTVGDVIDLKAFIVPNSIAPSGKWRTTSQNNGNYTLSEDGVLTIIKAPDNESQVFNASYVQVSTSTISQATNNMQFKIVPVGTVIEPTSLSVSTSYVIPVDSVARAYVSSSPLYTTASKAWSYIVADPSIVEAVEYPNQSNAFTGSYLYLKGIKPGKTTITVALVDYPNLTKTITVTVF